MARDRAARSLRANLNWRRLWLGQGVSLTGDYVFNTTVLLWVATVIAKGQTWAPAAASGVLIAAAVPIFVVGPVAGVYVDRWDRRRTMMTADACRALLIASLLTVSVLGHRITPPAQLAFVYGVVAAASCFAQFFNPSRLAILGLIVDRADRSKASGLLQATASFAGIIGPPLAAPLLFTLGVQWALIADAASFAFSFLAIRAIRLPGNDAEEPHASSRFIAEFRTGIQFFAGNRVLITICLGAAVATLGTGALNALMVFFITGNLHVAGTWLGTLSAGEAAGAVAGALLGGWLAGRLLATRVFWLGLIVAGIALLGFSRSTLLPAAIAALALDGVGFGASNVVIGPLILAVTPQHLLGRALAFLNPVLQLANILSMAAAGFLASTVLQDMHATIADITFGPYDTIFGCSALLIIAAGLAAIAPLRRAAPSPDNGIPAAGPPAP